MASRKTVTTWIAALALTLLVGLAGAPSAEAAASITFDQVVQGGTIAYSALGGPLVGTDILFDFFVVAGTAADGVYACSSCSLDFTTGNALAPGNSSPYTFAGGGSFTLTGGVPAMGIPDGTVLLTGSFTGPNTATTSAGVFPFILFTGAGVDMKNEVLAAFLGIDPLEWVYNTSEFSLGAATVNPDGTFSGPITQADLQNIKAVFEPGSALLLLLGLGSLAAYRRRA